MTPAFKVVYDIIGEDALDARLLLLKNRSQRNIPRQALESGMRVIAKRQRLAIAKRYRDSTGKRLGGIGSRVRVISERGVAHGKAGAGVGKSFDKMKRRVSRAGRKGVGFVMHWFVLGTGPRFNGRTTRAPGRRGKMTLTGKRFRYTGYIARGKFAPNLNTVGKAAWPEAAAKIRERFIAGIKAAWFKQYNQEAPELE